MLFRLPKGFQTLLITLMLIGMGWSSALPIARAADAPQALAGDLDVCNQGEGTGGISGTVTRADTGEPIEDAEIRIKTLYGTRITGTGSRFTNEEGFYAITGLPGGTYVVQVRPKFHAAAAMPIPVPLSQSQRRTLVLRKVVDAQGSCAL